MESSPDIRTLLLLRHAKAGGQPGIQDFERTLTDRGRRDAVAAGRQLHEWDVRCDLVLCSPAARTRQTWEGAERGGAEADHVSFRDEIYEARTAEVLTLLQGTPDAVTTLLVVGHGPAVPALAHLLAGLDRPTGGGVPLERLAEGHYPTSGLARFSVTGPWSDLGPATAELTGFEVPRG
jgi:phosphohistidine phosphatase